MPVKHLIIEVLNKHKKRLSLWFKEDRKLPFEHSKWKTLDIYIDRLYIFFEVVVLAGFPSLAVWTIRGGMTNLDWLMWAVGVVLVIIFFHKPLRRGYESLKQMV
jgi:hypothetical protein